MKKWTFLVWLCISLMGSDTYAQFNDYPNFKLPSFGTSQEPLTYKQIFLVRIKETGSNKYLKLTNQYNQSKLVAHLTNSTSANIPMDESEYWWLTLDQADNMALINVKYGTFIKARHFYDFEPSKLIYPIDEPTIVPVDIDKLNEFDKSNSYLKLMSPTTIADIENAFKNHTSIPVNLNFYYNEDSTSAFGYLDPKNFNVSGMSNKVVRQFRNNIGSAPSNKKIILEPVKYFGYLPVPMEASSSHIITPNIALSQTSISAPPGTITDNKANVVSMQGLAINGAKAATFLIYPSNQTTNAEIGLLDLGVNYYKASAYQSNDGFRKLKSGLRIKNNKYYLFNGPTEVDTGIETYTNTHIPIILTYTDNKIQVKNLSSQIVGELLLPTHTVLSKKLDLTRLMTTVRSGSIIIRYKPSDGLFFFDYDNAVFNNLPSSLDYVSTDPYFSNTENDQVLPKFDWMTESYNLRYKSNGVTVDEIVQSPFFSNSYPDIANRHDASGKFIGGGDYKSEDGWEMIKVNFGYDHNLNPLSDLKLRNEPYMILYNRVQGTLRVFIYLNNSSIANNLSISLKNGPNTGISEVRPAKIWGSYLQGKALNDPELSDAPYTKTVKLPSSSSGSFVYADFQMSYDPCIEFYESNIQIEVNKVTSGSLKIVGRSLGGSIPVGSPAIDNWLINSNNYLTGVLETPYGTQQNTLGDVSFRNFDRWGKDDWSNTANFVLPGKKIQAWQREAARLEYEANTTLSAAAFVTATGKTLKGSAKIAQVANPPFVNPGKVMEGAGELVEAGASFMKGGAIALRAQASRLKYDNLRDTPDKNIDVALPNPQPSVVFSELALSGTLQISTPLFDDVVITTPGSKNSHLAPAEYVNGSKGSYPLYNEKLGVFNMLYKPEFSIVFKAKNFNSVSPTYLNRGVALELDSKFHIASGLNKIKGFDSGYLMAYLVVRTFDVVENTWVSKMGKPYLVNPQIYNSFPYILDISDLVSYDLWSKVKNAALSNMQQNSFKNLIKENIQVSLQVEAFNHFGKLENGQYQGAFISQSFESDLLDIGYTSDWVNSYSVTENILSSQPTPDGKSPFGDDFVIWDGMNDYKSKMEEYCCCQVPNTSKMSQKGSQEKGKYDLTEEVEDILVYPNPSGGEFTVNYMAKAKGNIVLSITDINARTIISHNDIANEKGDGKVAKININDTSSGVYILNVQFENGEGYTRKIVVEKK